MFYTHISEMKMQYVKLDYFLKNYLSNIYYTNNVNMIIDLKECFRKIFRLIDTTSITYEEFIESSVGDIINMLGHYRNYFYNNYKYTTFYIIYSENECELMQSINPNYKRKHYDKYQCGEFKEYINLCLSVLKPIILNLPHVNYIDTSKYDDQIYVKYICDNHLRDINIILSNDYTFLHLLGRNIFQLNCKSHDAANMITDNNAVTYLVNNDIQYNISNKLIPVLLSFSGYDKYSISGIDKFKYLKAVKLLQKILDSNYILNTEYYSIDFSKIQDKKILENIDIITKNYKIFMPIDLMLMAKNEIIQICKNVDKVISINQFQELNSTYFTANTIDINKLFAGEAI